MAALYSIVLGENIESGIDEKDNLKLDAPMLPTTSVRGSGQSVHWYV